MGAAQLSRGNDRSQARLCAGVGGVVRGIVRAECWRRGIDSLHPVSRNVAIEYRWSEGRNERAAEIAAEFVRLKVDVIVTEGTANFIAAKQATSVIRDGLAGLSLVGVRVQWAEVQHTLVPNDADWNERIKDATKTNLFALLSIGVREIGYVYDMGDNWQHRIIVEKLKAAEPGAQYPQFLGGGRR